MHLFQSLLKLVKEVWHRRRSRLKSASRSPLAMELLDHRQLLTVTFTGNAIADIPDTIGTGLAIVQNTPGNQISFASTFLQNEVKVSGFDINAIRMFYSPADDTLSVAIEQPLNQKSTPQFPVIAGDADNNGNGGTVSPSVQAVYPLYQDYANLGGSEAMYVFLSLKNDGVPDVVAGISNNPGVSKQYQVAQAVVNPNPNAAPQFGATLANNTGLSYLNDTDPAHGAFEFQITNFAKLYKQETGTDLTASSTFSLGAFAGSADDFASELLMKLQPVSLGVAPISDCPPLSPPVLIAPHQNRHVNIAHASLVRVNVFGTSGFDVNQIDSGSVTMAGATPVAHFTRHINRDHFLDATYVFRSDQLNLQPGTQNVALTGLYNDTATGRQVSFTSANQIFVRGYSSYSPNQIAEQQARLAKTGNPIPQIPSAVQERAHKAGVTIVPDAPMTGIPTPTAAPTVRLALRQAPSAGVQQTPNIVINRAPGFRSSSITGSQIKGTQQIRLNTTGNVTAAQSLKTPTTSSPSLQVHDLALASLASA